MEVEGIRTQLGEFGAEMDVELVNDGPFTIWLDTADKGPAAGDQPAG
jgi:D-tyrosyl-tRNA(Tyr) deacylase